MNKFYRLIVCFFIVASFNSVSLGQDVESMLNVCCRVLEDRNEALYDEVENYLINIDTDSINGNLYMETLYHIALGNLYAYKYKDWSKSTLELEYLLPKIEPFKHLDTYHEPYKALLYAYGISLINIGDFDKAEKAFSKHIIEAIEDEYDTHLYTSYNVLAEIYMQKNNLKLAEDCHDKCQSFLINSYIRDHPEHSFYLDSFNSLKTAIKKSKNSNTVNTEQHINLLCSLGTLLNKIDQGNYEETSHVYFEALKIAIDCDLKKASGLADCLVNLQKIIIKNFQEPLKSNLMEKLVPLEIEYFSELSQPEDTYISVALSYAANQYYDKAIEYGTNALEILKKDKNRNCEKLNQLYRTLVSCYLGLSTDSANVIAFEYLQKLENNISDNDEEYYEWALENHGIILRYLYKTEDAIKWFNNNLNYFQKKYSEYSDQYISTLNQLALTYLSVENEKSFSYLSQAKRLIAQSENVTKSTIRGVSINLARYYISKEKYDKAMTELNRVRDIENILFGKETTITKELIQKCL